ncbi:MAG: dephospho-CoA kinase [Lachnospiraceae bacterium]
MKVIGMTGGVGSGKSTVLQYLKEAYQAHVILADEVGHHLMEIGGSTYRVIRDEYGSEILLENGDINRKRLAEIAFASEENRMHLNQLTHPLIKEAINEEIKRVRREGKVKFLIVEAAILVEGGLQDVCDEIWFVQTDSAIRTERIMRTRHYSVQKAQAMIASQPSDEEYESQCTQVIHNNTTIEDMCVQVDIIMKKAFCS